MIPLLPRENGHFSLLKRSDASSFPLEFRFLVVHPEHKHDIPMGKVRGRYFFGSSVPAPGACATVT